MAIQYALKVFESEEKRPFRTLDKNGEPWFVLTDVCRELGIGNPTDAAGRLDDDEVGIDVVETAGGKQSVVTISESGLYSLIMTSRKEGAKRFKKWVTAEVLPAIRKTGRYGGGTPAFIDRYNHNWDRVEIGYFSVMSELTIRLWGRLEKLGHTMADKAPDGVELRPDVSVGRRFADWLKLNHPSIAANHKMYAHWTPAGEFDARQYPNTLLPLYLEFVDTVWIPKHSEGYFNTRDPAALPYIAHLLPAPARRAAVGR
jgi:prophage antirepressor-like protein